MRNVRFIGLDVHAETIAVAVAESGGEVRSLGTIPNRPESVARLVRKLGKPEQLRACYEVGPTGYVLYWQLAQLGVKCEVVAPTLIPVKAGDRVKTDRGDAEKLARCYRGGDLTAVWVPDAAHEALRDLVRARLAAKGDQLRARNRLSKFLLRHGRRAPEGTKAWTAKHLMWMKVQRFEQAAQQVTLEDYRHEVEAAWSYRHRPAMGYALKVRQRHCSATVCELAWKAQHRLHQRYARLTARGKSKQHAVTAVARQLLGFIWAIGIEVERNQQIKEQRRAA